MSRILNKENFDMKREQIVPKKWVKSEAPPCRKGKSWRIIIGELGKNINTLPKMKEDIEWNLGGGWVFEDIRAVVAPNTQYSDEPYTLFFKVLVKYADSEKKKTSI